MVKAAHTVCGRCHPNLILNTCGHSVSTLIQVMRRHLISWISQQAFIRPLRLVSKTAIENLFGPQGVPFWLNYFHNDNLTYAVNNWVGAAAAADHLASQPRLQILEVGAGTGSATEILLQVLDERGLLPRLERYLITEPNAYFRRCNQRKLAAQYPNLPLEWATLDLNLPWNTQEIASAGFDLVYAVNVMHISKNLLFSLNRSELRPGCRWMARARGMPATVRKSTDLSGINVPDPGQF